MTFSVREIASSGATRRAPISARGWKRCADRMRAGGGGLRGISNRCAIWAADASRRARKSASPDMAIPHDWRIGKLMDDRSVHECSDALTLQGAALKVGAMAELGTHMAAPVTLTPRAVEQVREVRRREGFPDGHVLRVSVVGGGCSGFSYQLDFDEAPGAEDLV